jgi:hypothetical protein
MPNDTPSGLSEGPKAQDEGWTKKSASPSQPQEPNLKGDSTMSQTTRTVSRLLIVTTFKALIQNCARTVRAHALAIPDEKFHTANDMHVAQELLDSAFMDLLDRLDAAESHAATMEPA